MTVAGITVSDAEKAQIMAEAIATVKAQFASAVKGKSKPQATKNQALALPDGIEETDSEYIIHVPKNGRWHVSASGKSEVQNIDRLLPKGTHGLGLFGKIFRPA
jgi:hypothetical protein